MKKMELQAKAKQSQEKLDKLMDECFSHYEAAGLKGSTGYHGSEYEVLTRQILLAHGTKTPYVQASGKVDLRIKIRNAWHKLEIKTGSGIVATTEVRLGDNISAHNEAEILPKMDLVVYTAEPKELKDLDDLLDKSLVLTRQEFIEFAIANSGKRKQSFETAFKLGVNNSSLRRANKARKEAGEEGRYTDCITLQDTYNKNRAAAIRGNCEYTTLRDLLVEIGRL